MTSTLEALIHIQKELNVPKKNAPKDKKAKYKYRSLEDINSAVKPLAAEVGCAVVYTDEFTADGRCVSTCMLIGEEDLLSAKSECYVERNPQFMSREQASGAASSYARKYAACGLFALDSGEDPDYENERTLAQQATREPYDAPRAEAPQSDYTATLKRRMWEAIKRWSALHNRDPHEVLEGVRKRPNWADSAEFYEATALDFENDMNG